MKFYTFSFYFILLLFSILFLMAISFYYKLLSSADIKDFSFYVNALSSIGFPVSSVSSLKNFFDIIIVFIGVLSAVCPFLIFLMTRESVNQVMSRLVSKIPIIEHGVPNDGDDLNVMLKYYERAAEVHVFSGDFDWITGESKIAQAVMELAQKNRIQFYSARSREEVKKSLGELFEKLIYKFRFDVPYGLKCSVVKMQNGRTYLLYKSDHIEKKENRIFVFEDTEGLRFVLSKMEEILGQVSQEPIVIMVCGKTAAGKTVLCNALQAENFYRVSAGDVFRDLAKTFDVDASDREKLIGIGKSYLDIFGADALATEIIRRSAGQSRIVIDGVRPVETLFKIRRHFNRSVIIYLECDDDKRKDYAKKRGDRQAVVTNNEIDHLLNNVPNISDVVIQNENFDCPRDFTDFAIRLLAKKLNF